MNTNESSNTGLIAGVVVVAALIFGGLVWAILSAPSSSTPFTGNISFNDEGAPTLGAENAKVVVQVYSDLQCPACKAAEPILRQVIGMYKDRVKFVWKDFPLMSIHPNARNAANAARCAQDQGKFWEMHDVLFAEQGSWANGNPTAAFKAYATRLGLDATAFDACYGGLKKDAIVMDDVQEGNGNGVTGTPTVFIGNTRFVGGISVDEWKAALDRALAAAESGT